jgi:hypothetical protein
MMRARASRSCTLPPCRGAWSSSRRVLPLFDTRQSWRAATGYMSRRERSLPGRAQPRAAGQDAGNARTFVTPIRRPHAQRRWVVAQEQVGESPLAHPHHDWHTATYRPSTTDRGRRSPDWRPRMKDAILRRFSAKSKARPRSVGLRSHAVASPCRLRVSAPPSYSCSPVSDTNQLSTWISSVVIARIG